MMVTFLRMSILLGLLSTAACLASDEDDYEELLEFKQFVALPKIAQILEQTEQEYSGVVYDFENHIDDNELIYEVKLIDLSTNRVHKIWRNALSGKVIKHEGEDLWVWFFKPQKLKNVISLVESGNSILDLLSTHKLNSNDLFLEFELEEKQGLTFLEVEYLTPTDKEEVLINVENGFVIPVIEN